MDPSRSQTQYMGWKIDYANPPGEPGFVGPDSVHWRIYKNPIALGVGGVAAVLLEFADARIRSGVWDHSTYKADPVGRSRRTAIAAMVGAYGPQSAARRVIAGVNKMHAKVVGQAPGGEPYRALDPELLDWVSATAVYGFLTAYDRFVAPVSAEDRRRYFAESGPVARLYGVQTVLTCEADFTAMMERLAPRFEPHPIVDEFLTIIKTGKGQPRALGFFYRAIARAAVSILPPMVRARLQLGPEYDLRRVDRALVRAAAAVAERFPAKDSPATRAPQRFGLPANFLYLSRERQAELLTARRHRSP
ncbi:oxygenase MpaB family protein [Nannocystis radixulma]|uniref:Oxygenase MpaB family protein n=1 Tax=Nannocystis radixulma TaxID=2995305 RepID=A0ABT5AWY7_9BACT|nr:oxygenase MpaB family protein [Nannocystis radixulma]MDC0666362.1 oxygenase MpaB family protein [Nannocystis radixulma]